MNFDVNANGGWNVIGIGENECGAFRMRGVVAGDGSLYEYASGAHGGSRVTWRLLSTTDAKKTLPTDTSYRSHFVPPTHLALGRTYTEAAAKMRSGTSAFSTTEGISSFLSDRARTFVETEGRGDIELAYAKLCGIFAEQFDRAADNWRRGDAVRGSTP